MRTEAAHGALRLPPPRGRLVLIVAWSLGVMVVVLGAVYAMGIRGGAAGALAIAMAAFYGWIVVVFGAALVVALTGEPPAIERDGLRLRLRPWRRLVTLHWSEISRLWIAVT